MSSNGIDVSNNNGRLVLSTGFSGLDFVIAKRSEGSNYTDADYDYYEAETAKVPGCLFGAYHFLHAERQEAENEALYFLARINPRALAAGIWIDYETYGSSPANDREEISLFAETLKARVSGLRVGLYANLTGMRRVCPLDIDEAVDAFWLAYPGHGPAPVGIMPAGYEWNICQYETFAGVDRNSSRWAQAEYRTQFAL
jgi:GH25 family lysozyme M1 (1,4-beta-N-acetylmuramidase)